MFNKRAFSAFADFLCLCVEEVVHLLNQKELYLTAGKTICDLQADYV